MGATARVQRIVNTYRQVHSPNYQLCTRTDIADIR